jgi:TatD DNase family protein
VRLVDSHAHLQSEAFADDAAEVLDRARQSGVERLLIPAWDLPSSRSGLAFARQHGLLTSAGLHPHVAADADAHTWNEIRDLAVDPDVVAVGETGLDYDRGFSPREAQLDNLSRHIELAGELGKPLILHCRSAAGQRDAQDDLIALLMDVGPGQPGWATAFGDRPVGVLHSFSGPLDYAEAALELGMAVSFSGLVFRGGEEASAEVARLVPAHRLLVESDAPYLKPRGVRGSRNEPRNVAVTAAWVRGQRGDVDEAAFGDGLVAAFDRFVGAVSRT